MESEESSLLLPRRPALLAAVSVLVIAYSNYSMTGLAFLLAFYAWGLLYLRSLKVSATSKVRQSIWGLVSAGATALLIGQIVVQAIYAAGNADWATDEHTKRVLQLLGLSKAESSMHLFLVIAAPALTLLAATREIRATQSPHVGHPVMQDLSSRQASLEHASMNSTSSQIPLGTNIGYSNAGVTGVLAVCLAAVAWPSLLALPYLALLLGVVIIWSQNRPQSLNSQALRVLQVYTGVTLLRPVLHLWALEALFQRRLHQRQ